MMMRVITPQAATATLARCPLVRFESVDRLAMSSVFEGAILGLAIGDALGRPAEFIHDLAALREKYGPDGITDFEPDWHPAGTYTDDTQMSLAVARALIRAGHRPLDELMPVMAAEFAAWNRSPDNNRAPGTTCRAGCKNLEAGVPWRQSGVAKSKGCGSAMRTAPIGLCYHDDEARLIEVARASSLPTHRHPTALAAAVGTALLVAWAVHHDDPHDYPVRLLDVLGAMPGGTRCGRWSRVFRPFSASRRTKCLSGACLARRGRAMKPWPARCIASAAARVIIAAPC